MQRPLSFLLGTLLAGAALAGPLPAQAPVPHDPAAPLQEGETAPDPRLEERTRLLHLSGGPILRERSRFAPESGAWEVRVGREWQALPAGAVTRVADERELLAAYRERERDVPRDDPEQAARAELARWLAAEGLWAEAVDELNRVLVLEPNQPVALELVPAVPLVVPALADGPDPLAEVLRFGAQASPVGREHAIAELGASEATEALSEALLAELVSSSPRRRAFASHALRRLHPGEHLRELLGRAILDPSDDVRREASRALGDANEPAVIVPALRAMGSAHPKVRANAIEALGDMGYAAAVAPLVTTLTTAPLQRSGGGVFPAPGAYIFTGRQQAYIQDFDVEVAQFQAVADPQVNILIEGEVLDVRIQGATAKAFTTSERSAMRRSLEKLTGADPGSTTRAWERWWEEHQGAYAPPPARETTTTAPRE